MNLSGFLETCKKMEKWSNASDILSISITQVSEVPRDKRYSIFDFKDFTIHFIGLNSKSKLVTTRLSLIDRKLAFNDQNDILANILQQRWRQDQGRVLKLSI